MSAPPPRGMEKLISLVNKLQDAFTILGYEPLSLPQIAVVGGQSSGKSSVLENIVGRDFLPRGSGIVTRRPLVLQLISTPDSGEDWAEFLHKPGVKFTDFDKVRAEIEAATDAETGTNKGISDKPINLKVYSANVLNLTLVDLPGITRVPVGDQPPDIERLIRNMVLNFIKEESCIILAVTAANTDLANSDALQMAKEVDPEGVRTVGVLTKLDLMDRGTDAMDILEGRLLPLRLGYIPVINRSQEDIVKRKDITAQWDAEREFFATHSMYRRILDRCGTPYLAKTMNKLLVSHIRDSLPEISSRIQTFLQEKRIELEEMAELSSAGSRERLVLTTLTRYAEQFADMIDGHTEDVSSTELSGGARVAHVYEDHFAKQVDDMNILQRMTSREIQTIIRNCIGIRGGLFIPDQSFEVVIKRAIRMLDPPAQACVQAVYQELVQMLETIALPELKRFGLLRQRIVESSRDLLARCLTPTRDLVGTLVEMELCRVNTNHPDFAGKRSAVGALMASAGRTVTEDVHAEASVAGALSRAKSKDVRDLRDQLISAASAEAGEAESVMQEASMMEGRLLHKDASKNFASFKEYSVELRSRKLLYFETTPGAVAKAIDLDGCTVRVTDRSKYEMEVTGPSMRGRHMFRASNEPDLDKWVHAVGIASSQAMWDTWVASRVRRTIALRRGGAPGKPPPPPPPGAGAGAGASPPAPESQTSLPPPPPRTARLASDVGMSETERMETEVIRRLLESYFQIVRKKIVDSVPKAISLKLVNKAKSELHNELVSKLYKPELVDELLQENPETADRRKRCREVIELMDSALRTIAEVQMVD